ncbi:MAG: murein biosynthesis integral membrane protein MurJ [Phycisphaerae bacterium]|nr:murein biosynthesis integral membrane protein MurJ [Phycisphaerae bacterium]
MWAIWGIILCVGENRTQKTQETHDQRHFFRGATVIAVLTMLSRICGLVREAAISALGATQTMGAFRVAFSIPNLFRRLFGEGAVAAAFVPIFTETAQKEGWDKARAVLANVAGLLAVLLGAIVVIGELILLGVLMFAPQTALDAQHMGLTVQLTMIVLPFMLTICLLAIGSAALNCKGHFAYPAFAPIMLNLFLIAAAMLVHYFDLGQNRAGLHLLCVSVLAAGVTQLVGVIWLLKRFDLAAMLTLRPVLAPSRQVAALALPMLIPLGIMQFSAFFDRIYAHILSGGVLGAGVVTWFENANRLYQFPMAILGISLATAVFPLLSRHAADDDLDGLRNTVNRALRLSLFMGIPAGAALFVLAEPTMALIFRRGKFLTPDAIQAAWILRMYCLGMWAYFCNHILLRAFFAQKDTRTPLRVSVMLAALNVAMVCGLVFTPLKGGAMGLATAITASISTLVFTRILRLRWGRIGLTNIISSLVRILIASIAMCAAIIGTMAMMMGPLDTATNTQAGLTLLVCIPAGIIVFLAIAYALRCTELGELWDAITHRSAKNDK